VGIMEVKQRERAQTQCTGDGGLTQRDAAPYLRSATEPTILS